MAAPATSDEFLDLIRKTDVVEPDVLDTYLDQLRAAGPIPPEPKNLAGLLVRDGLLTHFQAGLFLLGRTTGFTVGKYRILERLGTGGMGSVFLCEDRALRRRVAVKVLPPRIAKDPASLARFHREAQVVAVLDHPNIVHAHDFCQDDNLYYLVMEFIDGASLQEIVDKHGPMDPERTAHYVRQTAEGLQHAHESGLVHRDIKPGNILVDRTGTVKVLDLGLARFTDNRNEAITSRFDDTSVMGTADYLAPEQALSLSDVDTRADIYSLGMTWYFLLAGHPPFREGAIPQKLLWHQMRDPTPIREIRPEVSEELAAVLNKMIAKDASQRYQTPGEAAEALAPFTQTAIPPPSEIELRRLSAAALGLGPTTGQLNSGPATMRGTASSWILPEGSSSTRTQTVPGTKRPNMDTPHPSGHQTTPDLMPVEEEGDSKKSDKNHRTVIQERMPDPSGDRLSRKQASEAEDVEVVEEETPSGRLRKGDKGRRKGVGSDSTTLPGRKKRKREKGEGIQIEWQFWVPVAATVFVALIAVTGIIIWKMTRPATTTAPDPSIVDRKDEKRPPGQLYVSSVRGANHYPSLTAAVDSSVEGDRIVVQLDTLEECVRILGEKGRGKNVIIESGIAGGKSVLWKAPPGTNETEPLLQVLDVSGLRIKGFRFDGQKKVNDLIVVNGRCPGTILEDLSCDNFRKSAIRFQQCVGDQERPVSVVRVRAIAREKENEAALLLEATPAQINQYIRVEDCRFEGQQANLCKSAIQLAGPSADIVVHRNRFFRTTDGVLYKKADSPPRLHLVLTNNTFHSLERGLHLEVMPLNEKTNRLEIKNNLFVGTKKLASADGPETQPAKSPAQWIWFEEGQPGAPPAGSRYFRRTFDVSGTVTAATLNVSADDSFVVYLNGEEVAKSPPHFTRRVYAVSANLAKKFKPGKNLLAVQATNTNDFMTGKPTNAALLVQLAYSTGGKTPLLSSDKNWKCSKTATDGWQRLEFDDSEWTPVKVLGGYVPKGTGPLNDLMWDSHVLRYFQGAAAPLAPLVGGNVRDNGSAEGYPPLEARGGTVGLPSDPKSDTQFLRYDKNSPLAKLASPPGVPPP